LGFYRGAGPRAHKFFLDDPLLSYFAAIENFILQTQLDFIERAGVASSAQRISRIATLQSTVKMCGSSKSLSRYVKQMHENLTIYC
jgi:hypothetical protein